MINEKGIKNILNRCSKKELIELIFKQNEQAFSSSVLYEFINYKVKETIKEINELNNKFDKLYKGMKQEEHLSKRREIISDELKKIDRKQDALYKIIQSAMKL